MSAPSSSSGRKYSAVWNKLKAPPHLCKIKTTHQDSATVIGGVKKEKNKDRNKPKNMRLDITSTEIPATETGQPSTIEITFRLVAEISINTI